MAQAPSTGGLRWAGLVAAGCSVPALALILLRRRSRSVSLDGLGDVAGLDASPKATERARSASGDLPQASRRGASEPAGKVPAESPSAPPLPREARPGEGGDAVTLASRAARGGAALSGDDVPTTAAELDFPKSLSGGARDADAAALAGEAGAAPTAAGAGKRAKGASLAAPTSPRIDLNCEGRGAPEGRSFAVEEAVGEEAPGKESADAAADAGLRVEGRPLTGSEARLPPHPAGIGADEAWNGTAQAAAPRAPSAAPTPATRAPSAAPTPAPPVQEAAPTPAPPVQEAAPTPAPPVQEAAPTPVPPVQEAAPTPAPPVQEAAPTPAPPVQEAAPTPAPPVQEAAPTPAVALSEPTGFDLDARVAAAAELDTVRATLASSSLGAGPFSPGARSFDGDDGRSTGRLAAAALEGRGDGEVDAELSVSEVSDLPAGSELSVPNASGLAAAISSPAPEGAASVGSRSAAAAELPPGDAATPPGDDGGATGRPTGRSPALSGEIDVEAAKASTQRGGPRAAAVATVTASVLSAATPDAPQAVPAWVGLSSPADSGTASQASASPAASSKPKAPAPPNLDRPPPARDAAGAAHGAVTKRGTPDRAHPSSRASADARGRRSRPPSTLSRPASGAATPGGDGRASECGPDDWGSSSDGEAIFQDVAMGGMEMDGLATLGARLAAPLASIQGDPAGLPSPGPLSAPGPPVDGVAPSIPLFSNFAARSHGSLGALSSEALDSAHSSPGPDSVLLSPVTLPQPIHADEPPAPSHVGVVAPRRVAAVEVPPTPRLRGGSPFGSSPFAHSSPMMEPSPRSEPPRPPAHSRRPRDVSAAPTFDSLQSTRAGRAGPVSSAGAPSSLRGSYRAGGIARPPCPPGPAAAAATAAAPPAGPGVSLPITLATTEVTGVPSRAPVAPSSSRAGRHSTMSSSLPSNYEDARLALKLDIVSGPSADRSYTTEEETVEITIGRKHSAQQANLPGRRLLLNDPEVSGAHAIIRWVPGARCWKIRDVGSMNGTFVNGQPIGVGRKGVSGPECCLSSDDIIQLGSMTQIKVSTFPRDLLDPNDRYGSLPLESLPRSLTMPKSRLSSVDATALMRPHLSPSTRVSLSARSAALRCECGVTSQVSHDHFAKSEGCEDVGVALYPLELEREDLRALTPPPAPFGLFGVFDGHCGRAAAERASRILPVQLVRTIFWSQPDGSIPASEFIQAFHLADKIIDRDEGCTATTVLAWPAPGGDILIQAANVGDSSALLVDPVRGLYDELTEDHRLSNPKERQRLASLGILLAKNSSRLYGLNLARGLGDKFLKEEDLGFSAEPFVSPLWRVPRKEARVLLIASDGLWDVADYPEIVALACRSYRDSGGDALDVAKAVLERALEKRTKDDVTVVAACFSPLGANAGASPPMEAGSFSLMTA